MDHTSRRKSNTTIIGVIFDDAAIIAADSRITCPFYGTVLDDNQIKMVNLFENVEIAFSGDGEFLLKFCEEFVPRIRPRPLNSVVEVAEEVLKWVNTYMEMHQSEVDLLIVGSMGNEKFQICRILKDEKKKNTKKSWMHKSTLIKVNFASSGSGGTDALDVLKKNKSLVDGTVLHEAERIECIKDALIAAVRADDGTGGILRAMYMTKKNRPRYYHWVPENSEYHQTGYSKKKFSEDRGLWKGGI